jgi:Cu(I)/Ag(I) efflux system membrane protein CusA/SilA
MVDAAIVMIENMHKVLEQWRHDNPDKTPSSGDYWHLAERAAVEVGPALFCSLLIITLSFIPVFSLEAQEGRMFSRWRLPKPGQWRWRQGLALPWCRC